MSEALNNFRESIDSDNGFQSKRRLLIIVSATFLALNLSGATLAEANTFLFKIKFTNYLGLSYMFIASILFLTLRYYSYAQDYHKQLYDFWSQRLMSDHRVYFFDHHDGYVSGLLGDAVDDYVHDEPGLTSPSYSVTGFFKRSISYLSEGIDEERGAFSCTKHIDLLKFNKHWKFYSYLQLMRFEFKYQSESLVKYRENLDLLAPYLLSLVSILSFVFKAEILSWLPTP